MGGGVPLDVGRLKKVKRLGDGSMRCQCPACATAGGDKGGNHLAIFEDGAFGCCVAAKDREHRKLIWKLAGARRERVWRL